MVDNNREAHFAIQISKHEIIEINSRKTWCEGKEKHKMLCLLPQGGEENPLCEEN